MTGPTHVVLGLAGYVTLHRLMFHHPGPIEILLVILGSLAPDIDGDGVITKPGRLFLPFLGKRGARFLDMILVPVVRTIHFLFGHRGITHSLVVVALGFIVAAYFSSEGLAWFIFAYLLHILADLLTPMGVPL